MTPTPMVEMTSTRDAFPARKGDWMQTFTGRRFWPLDPRAEDVSIEDIAHALSLLTRYGGHCTRFYSVAEHCVLLACAVPDEHRLWALLHDASEAYIADIVRPLKRHLDGYGAAEIRVMAAVAEHFRLEDTEPDEVKVADSRIVMDERAQVMRPTGDTWNYGGAREPLGITLPFWTPEEAERKFLALYSELTGYAVEMPPLTTLTEAVATAPVEAPEWRDIESAPKDGNRFWGEVDDDAIAMLWHEGFEAFVSSWRRMTMAPGLTINDKPYEDHTPVVHHPKRWMPLPAPPTLPPGGRTDG